jgi:hypothetical protein
MELYNFSVTRNSFERIYRTNFDISNKKYVLIIKEYYLGNGVDYTVKIKPSKLEFWNKRGTEFPKMTKKEWVEEYFNQSNKREL